MIFVTNFLFSVDSLTFSNPLTLTATYNHTYSTKETRQEKERRGGGGWKKFEKGGG